MAKHLAWWLGALAVLACALCYGAYLHTKNGDEAQWRLVQSSPTESSVVVVYYADDGCHEASGTSVQANDATVRIAVHLRRFSGNCYVGGEGFVRVRLGAPLGSRQIVGECTAAECQGDAPTPPSADVSLPVFGPK